MLNQLVIVGRITNKPILEKENEKSKNEVKLAVSRNYKNNEGIYEKDFIPVILYKSMAENVVEYCDKDDLIGVKGRLETQNEKLVVIADRMTFLSTRKREDNE